MRGPQDVYGWLQRVGIKRALWRVGYAVKKRAMLGDVSWPECEQVVGWNTCHEHLEGRYLEGFYQRALEGVQSGATLDDRLIKLLKEGAYFLYGSEVCQAAGRPMDWFLSVSGEHWSQHVGEGSYGEVERLGDIKDIWELGRCGWVLDLIRGGVSSTHETFFYEQVRGFCAQHERSYVGPHFVSGQEVALRAMRLCLGGVVFQGQDGDFECLQHLLYAHGLWVEENLDFARKVVPNNHVIAEAMSLWMLADCFDFWAESERWKRLSEEVFFTEIQAQFSEDGGYCQASHNYHRFAMEMLIFWRLLCVEGSMLAQGLEACIRGSAEYLWWWMMDEQRGRLPRFGASDGAHFLTFCEADYEDYRPALEVAHELCGGDGRWFERSEELDEQLYWVLGSRHDALEYRNGEARLRSYDGKRNGLNGLRVDGWQVALRVGEVWGTASQVDMGHVEIWRGDVEIALDRGSYRYHERGAFEGYAGLSGHNTLRFVGEEFAVKRVGRFTLWCKAWNEDFGVEGRKVWSSHHGWGDVLRGACHREIEVCDLARVMVRDHAVLQRSGVAVLRWQMGGVVVDCGDRFDVRIGDEQIEVRVDVEGGEVVRRRVKREGCSLRYGQEQQIDVIEVTISADAGADLRVSTEFRSCVSC